MSRVFDALRRTGSESVTPVPNSAAAFVDALEKNFKPESVPGVRAQLAAQSRLVFHTEPQGPAAERYRLLRLRLRAFRAAGELKTLLITSPEAREGKSTVVLNLAAALAEKGNESVLIVEADLRCPTLANELGLKLPSGLTQCTKNDVGLQSVIWRVEPMGFCLLPAGKPVKNPVELLNSEWFARSIKKLEAAFDWVLIDSPPAIPVVDTLSLKDHADASLLVVRARRTQQSAIDEAVEALGADHILGMLLNGVEGLDRGYYQYYRHYAPTKSGDSKAK